MILVTGATGNIGKEVLKKLLAKGQKVRATAINAEDAQQIPGEAQPVLFDFSNSLTFDAALKGVEKVFLMRPPQITDIEHTLNPFVDAAKDHGVRQIVFLSLLGVEDNPRVPHYAAEQYIKKSGVPYTLLRPSFFMQNLNTTHQQEIKEHDEIFIPVGEAKTSFIDGRDVGAVAAETLTAGGHTDKAYDLTGREALDYYQVADIFTDVLGRKITYQDPSLPAFIWRTWRRGKPLPFTLVMAMLYHSTKKGLAIVVSDQVENILNRRPTPFRQYVEDYRSAWQKDGQKLYS